jgi:hypothetical protein
MAIESWSCTGSLPRRVHCELRPAAAQAGMSRSSWSISIMSIASDTVGSLDAINRSASSSRTKGEESTPPRLEHNDDVAQSPFVPQRARVMPKGPPVYLGEPLRIDLPHFWSAPRVAQFRGNPRPATCRLTYLFAARAMVANSLGVLSRSGPGLQSTRMQ